MSRRARSVTVLLVLGLAACGGGDGGEDAAGEPDAAPRVDARLAACGLVEPGSVCTSLTALERCDGTTVVPVTCPTGTTCIDALGGTGATCIALPAPCNTLSGRTSCSGPVWGSCSQRMLHAVDCSLAFSFCHVNDFDVASCTTECELQGVDAAGRCKGGGIERCGFVDGHYAVETVACPAGSSCVDDGPETGNPSCVPAGTTCAGLGGGGACDGEMLSRCVSGARQTTDCAATGNVCVWGGDATGYTCAPPGTAGARRVGGVVSYEERVADLDADGALRVAPARGATVAVVDDATGAVLASAAAGDDGRYQIRYDAADGASVHVLAVSASTSPARPVRVMRTDGLLHGFPSPSMSPAADSTVDLLVTDRSGAGGAFGILDTLIRGMDVLRQTLEIQEPVPLVASWSRGYETISHAAGPTMFIGGSFLDDDSMDDAVLLHELGHYVETQYGRTSNTGDQHAIGAPLDPRLAWSEGWATYFSAVVRDDPTYIDSNLEGGFSFEIDTTRTLADPARNQRQDIAENLVSEVLWDLGDGGAGDDDPAPGPHQDVIRVQAGVLRAGGGDRGVTGVDLVDFLDGFLLLGGTDRCATTRSVVGSRQFPYDFAGPVPCP